MAPFSKVDGARLPKDGYCTEEGPRFQSASGAHGRVTMRWQSLLDLAVRNIHAALQIRVVAGSSVLPTASVRQQMPPPLTSGKIYRKFFLSDLVPFLSDLVPLGGPLPEKLSDLVPFLSDLVPFLSDLVPLGCA